MEPTEAQVKEFWERCGLTKDGVWWYSPTGKMMDVTSPRIDPNNLFKYAVPKIAPKTLMIESYIDEGIMKFSVAILSEKQSGGLWCGNDTDPALALFWALYEVMS